jgi:multidrug efflux system outer membrane protein
MSPKVGSFLLVAVLALSTACGVRRPYVAPTVQPAVLSHVDTALVAEQPFDPRWWQQFEDPVLDQLVGKALAANHDVRMAVARVDQARAFFDDVALDRYPTVVAVAPASMPSGRSTSSDESARRSAPQRQTPKASKPR